jgi:hypothetical protein
MGSWRRKVGALGTCGKPRVERETKTSSREGRQLKGEIMKRNSCYQKTKHGRGFYKRAAGRWKLKVGVW